MRIILLAALLVPIVSLSQINRSATLLASENIGSYVTDKLFKGMEYSPLNYDALKPIHDKSRDIYWQIGHRFEITGTRLSGNQRIPVRRSYYFCFYLDDRMRVKRAEAYYHEN